MIIEEMVEMQCWCGGMLIAGMNVCRCETCGRKFCAECGGEMIAQGGCDFCLSCAVSSCGA